MPSAPKLGTKASDTISAMPTSMSAEPGIIDRQYLQGIGRQQQADNADDARQYRAGIGAFEPQAVHAEHDEDEQDLGARNRAQELDTPARIDVFDFERCGVQRNRFDD